MSVRVQLNSRCCPTSRDAVNLMPDEEVNQRHKCREEGSSEKLPVLESGGVARAQNKASNSPRQGSHQV
jgi:hypothetical protein